MSATVYTIGINSHLQTNVKEYFKKFHILPPRNLLIGKTVNITGPASFENLLKSIAGSSQKTFVIVTHGHSDGSGVFLKLISRRSIAVGAKTTTDKLNILEKIIARKSGKASDEERRKLGIKDKEVDRLIKLMKKVKNKNITAVEFRGCNLGKQISTVNAFKKALGTKSFGAPDLYSLFGYNPAKGGKSIVKGHTSAHQGKTITVSENFSGKDCYCCIGINSSRKPVNGHIVADDSSTIDKWIQKNFKTDATLGKAKNLAIHGLWEIPVTDINDPDPASIFEDNDPRPIFPLALDANGKNEYQRHIIYA